MGIGAFNFPRRFLLPAAFRSLCLFDLNQPLLGIGFLQHMARVPEEKISTGP